MDIRYNVKSKTIKLLEDKVGENFDDFDDGVLDTKPINKLDFNKTLKIRLVKQTVKRRKRQDTDWKKNL